MFILFSVGTLAGGSRQVNRQGVRNTVQITEGNSTTFRGAFRAAMFASHRSCGKRYLIAESKPLPTASAIWRPRAHA